MCGRVTKTPGDEILSLVSSAERNILIVAPFIRSEALSRLAEKIPNHIKTNIVTRWRPADLVSGVSDLAVYDLAVSREFSLFVRYDLHAKYYAADDKCLMGSPNLTLTALGWSKPSNLELLTPVDRKTDRMIEFEEVLFSGTISVNESHRNRLERLLKEVSRPSINIPDIPDISNTGVLSSDWIPRSRNPEELFLVYSGNFDVSRVALQIMREELATIGVVPGLNEDGFRALVGSTIIQAPLICKVVEYIDANGQVSEKDLIEILRELGSNEGDPKPRDLLQVLERWFSYFLSDQYETATDSIKLIRAREV